MTDRAAAVAFRFLIAVVAMTAIAVVQIELERRTLLSRREHVMLVQQTADAIDRRNSLEVELTRLTAPGNLLKTAGDEVPEVE